MTYTQKLAARLMGERTIFPEMQSGKLRIRHRAYGAGATLPLASLRDAVFTGVRPATLLVREKTIIHELTEEGQGTWMTDNPCELVQMHQEMAARVRGRVLVGGLGLGVLPRMLLGRPRVSDVTVVESNQDVIDLVASYLHRDDLGRKLEVVHADIHEYVRRRPLPYDVALLDTWQGTGEWVWQAEVVPLRRAIRGAIPRVRCWRETMMINQVCLGLFRAASLPEETLRARSTCHWYAFRRAAADIVPALPDPEVGGPASRLVALRDVVEAELANRRNPRLRALAQQFLMGVGTGAWEREFGEHWDAAWEESE